MPDRPGVYCPRCKEWNFLGKPYAFYVGPVQCRECSCRFLVGMGNGYVIKAETILPPSDIDLPSPPVPERVRADLLEGGTCYSIGAMKATVVLCRRALEGMADDQGAQGSTLHDKIEALYASQQITKSLHEASTEIRAFGNYGAHPNNDLLGGINDAIAKEILYFTKETLDDVYVKPGRLNELRKRRVHLGKSP